MTNITRFDVIVIGGGPAGLVSALLAARARKKVALVGRPVTTGYEKVGESMPAATNRLLKKLQLPLLSHPTHDFIAGSESCWAGRYEQQDFIHHLQGCDWRLNRMQFEYELAQLVQESGVCVIAEQLIGLHHHDLGWRLETDEQQALYGDFIIDASGRSCVLARHLSLAKEKSEPLVALWASVDLDNASYQGATSNTLIESQKQGWWYAARLPSKKMLAIFHTNAVNAAAIKKQPQQWQGALNQAQMISKRFPIDCFIDAKLNSNNARSTRLITPYGKNWAACGDAAVSFDPLSSQGIYNAIATAAMLHKALQRDDRDKALTQYESGLQQVAKTYQQKRQQYYQQAYDHHQTDFWQAQL